MYMYMHIHVPLYMIYICRIDAWTELYRKLHWTIMYFHITISHENRHCRSILQDDSTWWSKGKLCSSNLSENVPEMFLCSRMNNSPDLFVQVSFHVLLLVSATSFWIEIFGSQYFEKSIGLLSFGFCNMKIKIERVAKGIDFT